jgi:hypothetical protein
MSSLEQIYYEALARTDHPVFARDFSQSTTIDSPLNSIFNRITAKALVRLRAVLDEMALNIFPATVTSLTIDDWELEYFGFTKPSLDLSVRVSELLIKYNRRFSMSVPDVLQLSKAIVGQTPYVTRNVQREGWVLGRAPLGIGTTFGGDGNVQGLYLVYFPRPTDSGLLQKLDDRLTSIEKAGSRHRIKAPIQHWVLGRTALGINTTLGA